MSEILSDRQIEIIADIFANGKAVLMPLPIDCHEETKWVLNHAFQSGAKFYRSMIMSDKQFEEIVP